MRNAAGRGRRRSVGDSSRFSFALLKVLSRQRRFASSHSASAITLASAPACVLPSALANHPPIPSRATSVLA